MSNTTDKRGMNQIEQFDHPIFALSTFFNIQLHNSSFAHFFPRPQPDDIHVRTRRSQSDRWIVISTASCESLLFVHYLARSLLLVIGDILDISKSELILQYFSNTYLVTLIYSRGRTHNCGGCVALYSPNRLQNPHDSCRSRILENLIISFFDLTS